MGEPKIDKNILNSLTVVFSTLLGLGFVPLLGGTIGSLCGLLVFSLWGGSRGYALAALLTAAASFFISHRAEELFREKDCKKIIIDDFSGMLISFLFIPRTPFLAITGFILFRAFDFFKVYPANRIERLHGGLGVTGDDIIAGIYTNLILQILRLASKTGV